MKSIRTQIYLPEWLKNLAKQEAKKKGVNTSEFIRDVLKLALQDKKND